MFSYLDRFGIFAFGEKYNPFSRLGALAVSSILIAVATGIMLLPFYSTNVHEAYSSVAGMVGKHRFSLGLLHSIHRYSSDLAVFFTVLHLLKTYLAKSFFRSRILSWETGLIAMGLLWFIGWTGYWLVWDQAAFHVAQISTRMIDSLPIFGTFLEQGILLDDPVNNQFFFIVFFIHMIIPIGLFGLLWLHVSRVNRPNFLTDKKTLYALLGILMFSAIAFPARINAHADSFALVDRLAGDAFFLLPIRFLGNFSSAQIWLIFLGAFFLVAAVPWIHAWFERVTQVPIQSPGLPPAVSPFTAPSFVDESRCTGCGNCHNDCPYQAIEMRPRPEGSKHRLVAWVDSARCLSCGICNGACDSNGNNLPWLSTDEIESRIRTWSPKALGETERRWLLFICQGISGNQWWVDPKVGLLPKLRMYRVIEVPCAGHVNPKSLKLAYEQGFVGTMIATSLPGSCNYREGNQWIEERVTGKRQPFGRLGRVDRLRTHVVSFGSNQTEKIIQSALEIAKKEI